MPDLAALPRNSLVFVDTMIFDLHFRGKSATCTALINRIATGEVTGIVNTQVLADLLHKLMLHEAASKGHILDRNARKLREALAADRSIGACLLDCQTQLEQVLAIGMRVVPVTRRLLVETKAERQRDGLMTGDSLHVGNMNRHAPRIVDIATNDGDFGHINGITIWKPMDVIL